MKKLTKKSTRRVLKRKNPENIYGLWRDLSSKDKAKARKAALALRLHFSKDTTMGAFWPIIREENDLTKKEIIDRVESVISKTSGARANPSTSELTHVNLTWNEVLRGKDGISIVWRKISPNQYLVMSVYSEGDKRGTPTGQGMVSTKEDIAKTCQKLRKFHDGR